SSRGILMLYYSLDGLNWFEAGCIVKAQDPRHGFQYATPAIDGDDLVVLSRTNINGPIAHDADRATFHRVHDFRSLALSLL
ncbi:MAG: exo-alpha-sialidase, partial [bacterium]